MKKVLLMVMMAVGFCLAQDTTQIVGVAKINRVYDGDTFFANLYNLPDIFGKDIGIRLVGIDTPELNSTDSCNRAQAKAARAYLEQKLKAACRIELRNLSRDKYFRVDAVIYVDGVNINQEMVTKGYAKAYTGEGPKPTHTCPR